MCTCGPSDTPEPAEDPESRLAWSDPEWYFSAGAHYRDLSVWLKEVASRCRLPNRQRELLTLARKYERLAARLERNGPRSPRR